MKKRNETCEECNGHISYDVDVGDFRCDGCGVITDDEGCVIYVAATVFDL